jgi:hypothetical protein
VHSHKNRLKNALFTANNVILRKKICARPKFFKNSLNRHKIFFGQNKKIRVL